MSRKSATALQLLGLSVRSHCRVVGYCIYICKNVEEMSKFLDDNVKLGGLDVYEDSWNVSERRPKCPSPSPCSCVSHSDQGHRRATFCWSH